MPLVISLSPHVILFLGAIGVSLADPVLAINPSLSTVLQFRPVPRPSRFSSTAGVSFDRPVPSG